MLKYASDPAAALEARIQTALQSGVPAAPLRKLMDERKDAGTGIERIVTPDRDLVPGVEVQTDLGTWTVHETPGHAPSHVSLFQPEKRMLISGDHLLGRVSLYYDYGYTADPAGEFLRSLDVVDALDARLCLSGHGRTFTDVRAHVEANRATVHERLTKVEAVLAERGPISAFDALPHVYGKPVTPMTASWWLNETLSYLTHLAVLGRAERVAGEAVERWRAV